MVNFQTDPKVFLKDAKITAVYLPDPDIFPQGKSGIKQYRTNKTREI